MSLVGLESMIAEVWSLLMDKQVGVIGVWGIGGVGKTALLKQIYNKLAISRHDFDIVIWIQLSPGISNKKIQDEIWKRIGVFQKKLVNKNFDEKTKAKAIHDVLCGNKFAVFFDGLLGGLDLTKLGIPKGQNESKVILTIRSPALFESMSVQKAVSILALNEKHALELFKKKVGEDKLSDPNIHHLASLIARECEGVPQLLCIVARAMTCRSTYDRWEDALKQVKQGIRFFGSLDFGFASLPSATAKSCLLYCLWFPENFMIPKNDLIDLWTCEHLLDPDDTGKDVLNLGYNTVDALIDACLLEEGEENCVVLQNVVHDFFYETYVEGEIVTYSMSLEQPRHVGWVSSMADSIQNLANIPLDLLTLLLDHDPFIMIEDEFSQLMHTLKVLDLSNSAVEEVPRGISKLISLQYLNLSHTCIEYLPVELKMLTNLKCLNLEHDVQLRLIPRQLIYGLSSLQVLKMFRCGFSVEEVEDNILSVRNMNIDPLLGLEHLKVLSITITCASALQQFFSNPKLVSCTQSLSLEVLWGSKSLNISPLVAMKNLQKLEIHHAERLEDFTMDHGCSKLLHERCFERLEELRVENCSSLCDLTWIILAPNLRVLGVKSCEQVEDIISIKRLGETLSGRENLDPFAKLEILELESLPELKSIYGGSLPLRCLKKIGVIDCSELKKLPLKSGSRNEDLVIRAEEDWWNNVEWEDDATEIALRACFTPVLD